MASGWYTNGWIRIGAGELAPFVEQIGVMVCGRRYVAKVVITKLKAKTAREISAKGATVTTKRVANGAGRFTTIRTLDSGSASFGTDFTRVFGANVKKAREENKRLTGAADGVPDKC